MTAKTVMIQGTGSHVGKSLIVAGLCRLFSEECMSVAPFKSQNMALNSFATADGREIGRAQATQAQAAGITPSALHNPILLKPTSDRRAQVVVLGKPVAVMDAKGYHAIKREMLSIVAETLAALREKHELVIIEGAGSPAEINLADQDIANMAVAALADAPVVLVADIDKGGSFAAIVGTLELLPPVDRERVRGFIINKFRGDIDLLRPGLDFLEARTGLPVLGVIPHIDVLLEAEDSVSLETTRPAKSAPLRIAIPRLPRISNFTDFQPFEMLEDVSVDFVRSPNDLGRPDAVIVPGTKSTLLDLEWLRRSGLADAIVELAFSGVPVIGICGGFQMLGNMIFDPLGVEGRPGDAGSGLGLLAVETVLAQDKAVNQVQGSVSGGEGVFGAGAIGANFCAYEIHAGVSQPVGAGHPFSMKSDGSFDGWISPDHPVVGTYMHGIFECDALRRSFIGVLAAKKGIAAPESDSAGFEARIGRIAEVLRGSLDMDEIRRIIGIGARQKEDIGVG